MKAAASLVSKPTMPCQHCGAPNKLTAEDYMASVPCPSCIAKSDGKPLPVDPSILGVTADELKDMDDEERKAKMVELLNQAADLAEAVADAFKPDLGSSAREKVKQAVKLLVQVARGN